MDSLEFNECAIELDPLGYATIYPYPEDDDDDPKAIDLSRREVVRLYEFLRDSEWVQ